MSIPNSIPAAFDLQLAYQHQRRKTFGYAQRRDVLRRLSAEIRAREPQIIAALQADFGKPASETILSEILVVQQDIKHTLRHLRRWMRPRRVVPTLIGFGTSARVEYQARGQCLIIAPWNYPFNLAFGPLVSCIAAGNSAIVKPSEMTPATSALIGEIVAAVFPPELVTVIEGGIPESTELLALPFDHIFFTGSPAVGQIVMAAAAKTLASVTLELGGKSPTIIGPDADIKQAAKWVAFGKFSNGGQTCIAPDHLYVHETRRAEFITELGARIASAYADGPTSPHLARMVNAAHADRVWGLVQDARAKGAALDVDGMRAGDAIGPTVLGGITPDMDIDGAEIFGPVLPIMGYSDIDTVIAQITARPKPLALYIFAQDKALVRRVLDQTSSGGVGVNLTMAQYSHNNLPFGGVNNSGIGNAHGMYGFRAFSHERAVLRNRFSLIPLIFPPYTGRVRRLIGVVRRVLG
ncbi:aldehyde dehydrogenase [Amylibacter marinus]|uniref:Aldehyde dehydrogenase n=1 Tax=Amylibacter marinus TaxID=1475483 RepID=A0ABQ5VYM6_9RHOB|nr:aldehyde dehydrogenase family protein [Amylibacter marinus]GLQ36351.1 aldehyde dehydrogenase [Amylibacter marinus]